MERIVEKEKALLISGPASISLINGKATVLGSQLMVHKKVVIRRKKTLPFETE